MRKARIWRAFLIEKENSPNTGMAGWRRSADRTCLYVNSLLTGNFTGNLTSSTLRRPFLQLESAVLQWFVEQFPNPINREIFSKNREKNWLYQRIPKVPVGGATYQRTRLRNRFLQKRFPDDWAI
jgi:hypothetical protein